MFQGSRKTTASTNVLTEVQALIDDQSMPLCQNPDPLKASGASAWVMIDIGPASANDYIQMGFWNCAIGCGYACCQTNGLTHLFWERNNGNPLGQYRQDLAYVGSGQKKINITYYCPSDGSQCKFIMSMDNVTDALAMDNGWRDWSLQGANFDVYTESWNPGDQNGGAPGNSLFMQKAKRGVNLNPITSVSLATPCQQWPGPYGCQSLTDLVANDGVATWTNDR